MKPVNVKVFDARSVYSHRKCIRINLDLEGYGEITTSQLNNFNERLLNLLPELRNHQCSYGEEFGFVRSINEGIYLHHLCGHIAVAVQNRVGVNVSFCAESKGNSDNCYTIYEFKYKKTGVEAGNIAVDIINSLIENSELNLVDKIRKMKEILRNELEDLRMIPNPQEESRHPVPIIAITGTNGKTTTTRLIAYTISKAGFRVGMTTTDGIYINGRCVFEGDTTGPRSAQTVLSSCDINAAVLETARGGMVRDGLAYDLADVAVITNIGDDHLGLNGIETLEDLAKVKALVGEAVKANGYVVINGDDSMSISICERFRSKLIIFSEDRNNRILQDSIKNGGYGVYIDDGMLFVENERTLTPVILVKDIGITLKGVLRYNIQNAMAACGALIGFGIDPFIIKEGLEKFQCNEDLNPGRFNVFDVNGVLTILDYGHNIDGYRSVLEGLTKLEHNSLIGIIGVPGDRLDRTTLEVGRIAGSYFQHIFIKEDKDRRGRLPGEIAELLKEGVLNAGFDSANVDVILDEEAALENALETAKPGDIVIIFFEEYHPLLQLVKNKINSEVQQALVI